MKSTNRCAWLLVFLAGCTSIPEGELSTAPVMPGTASPLRRSASIKSAASAGREQRVEPGVHSLASLIRLVEISPGLAAARQEIARETGAVIQADFVPNPVVTLETDMMPMDDMGFGNARNKVKVSQRIETAGKAGSRVSAAIAKRREAEAAFFHERALMQADTAREFYKALFTRKKMVSAGNAVAIEKELLSKANDLGRVGRLSDVKLIRYEIAVQKSTAAVRALAAEEKGLLRGLEGRLGLEAGAIAGLEEDGGSASVWTPPADEEARAVLLRRYSRLIVLDRKLEYARAGLDHAERLAYPDVTIGLGYIRGAEMGTERDDFVGGFVQVPFPLIDRNQGNIARSHAEVRKAESELVAEASKALDEWQGLKESSALLEEELELYRGRIIPLLEKELFIVKSSVDSGREPVQRALDAALELEKAMLDALQIEESLALLSVDMKHLLGWKNHGWD